MACAVLIAALAPAARAELLSPVDEGGPSASALPGVTRTRRLVLDRVALAGLRARDRAVVHGFPLGHGRTADVVLERFDPFTAGARAEVVEADGRHSVSFPDRVYFRGTVAGEADSHVFLVAGRTRVHGFVVSGGDVFPFGPDQAGRHRAYAMRDADPTVYPPPGDFCGNDLYPEAVSVPATEIAVQAGALPPAEALTAALKQADVAIETDQELRAKFTSDTAALNYLTSLAAAATSIYERDVAVRLRFSYIRLWGASTRDPWSATDASGTLTEVRNYWNDPANAMAGIAGPRTVVHFLSGKTVHGGIAYIDTLCNASYGYGVSQVFGSFDLSRPSQIWDVEVFTHELGHNFGSPHTHCYSPPLDECYNREAGCYSGPVVASRGTIMSYCHLLAGGLSNIDLLFGGVVSQRIDQSVAGARCLATVSASTTTTTRPPLTTSTTTTRQTTTTRVSTTTTTVRPPTTTTLAGTGDADGDGVPDRTDACPGTPRGDPVDGRGCSLCPCAGPRPGTTWSSHTDYLACMRQAVGTLAGAPRRTALDYAERSSCGRRGMTRCCVFRSASSAGRCRILRQETCAVRAGAGRGFDAGTGSCAPVTCTR